MVRDPVLKSLALQWPVTLSVFHTSLRSMTRQEFTNARRKARIGRRHCLAQGFDGLVLADLDAHHRVAPCGRVFFRTDRGSWLAV